MKRNLRLILAALFALTSPSLIFARGNGAKVATPVYEDQTNGTEFSSVNVGTTTAVKLNTPIPYKGARDERHLRIQNNSTSNSLHIATYTIKMQDSFLSSTVTANTFVIGAVSYLDLSPKTTYYGIYDSGASSQGAHVQLDFHNPAAVQPGEPN